MLLPESPRPVAPRSRRRWGQGALITVGVVVAVGLLAMWMTGGSGPGTMADPDSASRNGSKALAQVLREQGVDVEVVRTIQGVESAAVDPTATVVVSSFDYLGEAAALRLADQAASARRLVLLEPGDFALADLGVPLQVTGNGRLESTAGCTTEVADRSDRIEAPGSLYGALQTGTDTTIPTGTHTGTQAGTQTGAELARRVAELCRPARPAASWTRTEARPSWSSRSRTHSRRPSSSARLRR